MLLYIIKDPMKVICGLLPETWGYFCMKNFISTTRNCHSRIHERTHFILFALLKVHPRVFFVWLVGPLSSWAPADPPSQWACNMNHGSYELTYLNKRIRRMSFFSNKFTSKTRGTEMIWSTLDLTLKCKTKSYHIMSTIN